MTTLPLSPTRRCLAITLIPILLILLPSLILLPHLLTTLTTALLPPPPLTTSSLSSSLPPPLSHVYTPPPTKPPPFSVPHIIRPFYHAPSSVLHVYTGGIHMGVSNRNLTVAACVVGTLVYPVYLQHKDVMHCRTPLVNAGENVSVLLLENDQFRRQMREGVVLVTGVKVQLKEGDHVVPLPHSYHYDMPFINATGTMSENEHLYPRQSLWLVTASQQSPALETPSPSFPRYRFCLMTQIAPFSYLLEQWVSHHRRMGFDHVYIFDNGAALNLTHIFRNRPDVEVINWPYDKSQLLLVGWFFKVATMRCEYVAHVDVDEFLFAPLGSVEEYANSSPLADVVRRVGAEWRRVGVKFPWVLMKNNGYASRQQGYLPELYTQRNNKQTFHNGKAMCRTELQMNSGLVHSCGVRQEGSKVQPYLQVPKSWEEFVAPTKRGMWPVFVHFRERSWEENVEKWSSGRASGKLVGEIDVDLKAGAFGSDKYKGCLKVQERLIWTDFRDHCRRVRNEGDVWERVAAVTRRRKRSNDGDGDGEGEEMECVEIDVKTGKETGKSCR